MSDVISGADRRELISFRIGDQELCVDIMTVREIRGWTPATPLPRSPAYMRGVINLRGAVLPIVDLAVRLGYPPAEPTARHVIMVVRIGRKTVGLLVDAVSDIVAITEDRLQPTPDVACEEVRGYVKGLFAMEGRMIGLLSLERILPELEAEAA